MKGFLPPNGSESAELFVQFECLDSGVSCIVGWLSQIGSWCYHEHLENF